MNHALRQTAYAVIAAAAVLALSALPAAAIDINNLPDWVRDSIHPVEIDWSQVYPGLAPPPAWAQGAAGLQEVRPRPLAGLETASPAAGPSGVGTLTPLHPASAAGGLQPVTGGSMVAQVNRLSTVDAQPQQLLLTWRSEMEAGAIDRDALLARIVKDQVPADTLVAVLELLPLAHPMDPLYFPVCGALWDALDEDLDACLKLPYATRIYMAAYLGVLERPDDTKALVNSLENPDPMALGADIYHVSNQLADHERTAYRLAIWAWKKGATLRGPADQAFVCKHTIRTCAYLYHDGDKDAYCEEIIPWAEEALARPGSESMWGHAIYGLVYSYATCGETERAISRGQYWLEEARKRDLPLDYVAKGAVALARMLTYTDEYPRGADMLRRIVRDGDSAMAGLAQFHLLRVAKTHPDVGDVIIIPPKIHTTDPATLTVSLTDAPGTGSHITLRGSHTLNVEHVTCDVPFVRVVPPKVMEAPAIGTIWTVEVVTDTHAERKAITGVIVIRTNDPERPTIRVPLAVVDGEPASAM